MKRVLSILLAVVLLASVSLTAFADVVIQDMPKSNHKIKEVTYYDKNPDPSAEGEMAEYPAVWMHYDDPDNHTNSEVFVLKEVASQEEAKNTNLGYDGFRINGKWYKVVGLWTVNPEKDIIDKGNGEKAVFTPIYYGSTDKPQPGEKVLVAIYDYESKGISNLVDVTVPEKGKETYVEVKDNITATAVKPKIYVGESTTIEVKNGSGTSTFTSSDKKIAVVDTKGKVTGKSAGTVIITVENSGEKDNVKITVIKKTNTVIMSVKKITIKHNRKAIIKGALKIKDAKGEITFKKKSGNKKITVNKKSGTITVKSGLKKGKTYKLKIKVTAKGNTTYKSVSKTVTVKIKVK